MSGAPRVSPPAGPTPDQIAEQQREQAHNASLSAEEKELAELRDRAYYVVDYNLGANLQQRVRARKKIAQMNKEQLDQFVNGTFVNYFWMNDAIGRKLISSLVSEPSQLPFVFLGWLMKQLLANLGDRFMGSDKDFAKNNIGGLEAANGGSGAQFDASTRVADPSYQMNLGNLNDGDKAKVKGHVESFWQKVRGNSQPRDWAAERQFLSSSERKLVDGLRLEAIQALDVNARPVDSTNTVARDQPAKVKAFLDDLDQKLDAKYPEYKRQAGAAAEPAEVWKRRMARAVLGDLGLSAASNPLLAKAEKDYLIQLEQAYSPPPAALGVDASQADRAQYAADIALQQDAQNLHGRQHEQLMKDAKHARTSDELIEHLQAVSNLAGVSAERRDLLMAEMVEQHLKDPAPAPAPVSSPSGATTAPAATAPRSLEAKLAVLRAVEEAKDPNGNGEDKLFKDAHNQLAVMRAQLVGESAKAAAAAAVPAAPAAQHLFVKAGEANHLDYKTAIALTELQSAAVAPTGPGAPAAAAGPIPLHQAMEAARTHIQLLVDGNHLTSKQGREAMYALVEDHNRLMDQRYNAALLAQEVAAEHSGTAPAGGYIQKAAGHHYSVAMTHKEYQALKTAINGLDALPEAEREAKRNELLSPRDKAALKAFIDQNPGGLMSPRQKQEAEEFFRKCFPPPAAAAPAGTAFPGTPAIGSAANAATAATAEQQRLRASAAGSGPVAPH